MQISGRSTALAPMQVVDNISGNGKFSGGAFSQADGLRKGAGAGSFHGNTFRADQVKVGGSVAEKQALAKKRALHVVSRAYDGEKRLDGKTAWMRDNVDLLQKSITEHEDENRVCEEKLGALREKYGIDPEGEEQKALEAFARRYNNPKAQIAPEDYDALTDYQAEALFYQATHMQNEQYLALDKPNRETFLRTIKDLRIERLKSDPVGEAEEQAAAIEAASAKDAVAQLTQEMRQRIDDKDEAVREEIKEAREERAQETKEEKEKKAQEDLLEAATEQTAAAMTAQTAQALVNSQVEGIINSMSLLTEDIKGAEVDAQL